MLAFVHTADLQLGMPFRWAEGDRGARLRQLRFEALDRVIDLAHARDAAFLAVAGDVFDSSEVDEPTVAQACNRFRRARMPVLLLPGNHDPAGEGSVWNRRTFRDHRPDNLQVLDTPEPVVLAGGRAVVLPAPLMRRHSRDDLTATWTPHTGRDRAPDAVRVGLAHGSVADFGESVGDNRIDPQRATRADLDYLALGDWHGSKEVGPRAWYAGTPEPTAFKDNDAGNALVVRVGRGRPPEVERVPVGRAHWIRRECMFSDDGDLAALQAWLDALPEPHETLVRLELGGSLGFVALEALESLLEAWEARLLHLRRRGDGVRPHGRPEEFSALATAGYIAEAVAELRRREALEGEEGARAAAALRLLYRLHRGAAA
jgi:DNA repair exonuclease SbcCD nuclease subunit